MSRIITRALAGAILLFAGTLFAEDNAPLIRTLPDTGTVTLSGKVEKIGNDREFTLADDSGTIKVNIPPNESVVLKEGDKVAVTGTIEKSFFGWFGKYINASSIDVHKELSDTLSDVVRQNTGVSVDQAKTVQIANLSEQGLVKLSGTVANVIGAKSFILEDSTGTINVNVQSDENVALIKGAKVTLIGYVENGLLGKSIRANHVIVTTDADPHAQN